VAFLVAADAIMRMPTTQFTIRSGLAPAGRAQCRALTSLQKTYDFGL
jgi:hypothetical protein